MTVYVHKTVGCIGVSPGHVHTPDDHTSGTCDDPRVWSFNCSQVLADGRGCEATVAKHYDFAALNPSDVALTPDEQKAQASVEKDSVMAAGALMRALTLATQRGQDPFGLSQPIAS